MASLLEILEPSLLKLDSFIHTISANVPVETDWEQSSFGSWYNTPRQHAFELLFLATTYSIATYYLFKRLFGPGSNNYKLIKEFEPFSKASLTERGLTLSLICSILLTLTHKILRRRVWFMLQPCHMSGLLLIFTLVYPNKKSLFPHIFFNIYLHLQWGALSALVFPDTREHTMIGETFNFFAEHILLLVVPIYMIYSRRYIVFTRSKEILFFSWFSYCFYHTPILHICSLISGFNINYIWTPPSIPILLDLGPNYRIFMYGACFIFKLVTRFLFVEALVAFMPRKKLPIQEKANQYKKKSKKIQ